VKHFLSKDLAQWVQSSQFEHKSARQDFTSGDSLGNKFPRPIAVACGPLAAYHIDVKYMLVAPSRHYGLYSPNFSQSHGLGYIKTGVNNEP
jgi:hypothetical protein